MTKKDYELLADTIREEIQTCLAFYETTSAAAVARYAESLATELGKRNPRFNRERFLAACGTELAFS